MYLVFTYMPAKSYRRRLRPLLLCLCDVFVSLFRTEQLNLSMEGSCGHSDACKPIPAFYDTHLFQFCPARFPSSPFPCALIPAKRESKLYCRLRGHGVGGGGGGRDQL